MRICRRREWLTITSSVAFVANRLSMDIAAPIQKIESGKAVSEMKFLPQLFDNNRAWAERIKLEDPAYFERLSHAQTPEYLWIGCADSRVPANEIVGLGPGELFGTATSPIWCRHSMPTFTPSDRKSTRLNSSHGYISY